MSIQSKELRVGNKLFTNLKNIHTVCQIHFEPGTKADWVFNGWYKFYEYEEFKTFAAAELAWVQN